MNARSRLVVTRNAVSRWFLLLPLLSSLFYVVSYVCMRTLAQTQANVFLSVGIREGITGLGGAFIFAFLFASGRAPFPKLKHVLAFTATSLALQLVGNIYQQQSFEIIGMGLTTASCWTGQLLLTPILGWLILREKLTLPLFCSLLLAFVALLFLSSGAEVQSSAAKNLPSGEIENSVEAQANAQNLPSDESENDEENTPALEVALPQQNAVAQNASAPTGRFSAIKFVLLSSVAGFIMAASNCVIRKMNQAGNSPFFAVMFLPGIGGIFLLGADFIMNGGDSWSAFSAGDYLYSTLAGLTNLLAFIVLTFSLRFLSAVRVCVVMISQLALAPLAGRLIFCEPLNGKILLGILLVVGGVLVSALAPQKELRSE